MFGGRNQKKANRLKSWWEFVRDHPPRMERQMRYPVSSWGRCLTVAGPSSAGAGMSRICLEGVEENFPTQLVREPARDGTCWTCCSQREKDLWVMQVI